VSLADLGTVLDQVRGSGLAVDLTVEGTPGPLAPSVDLTAYRIIQEALTNTVRHASAARAAVTLCYEPGFVTVSVTDTRPEAGTVPAVNGTVNARVNGGPVNGSPVHASLVYVNSLHGLPANGGGSAASGREAPVRSGGFGLAGIAERVASCGGSLSVGPTGAGGFAVTARLPAR
jgi:signal transduction histidine kinase